MTITALVSSFAPFNNFCVNVDDRATISDVYDGILAQQPCLRNITNLRLTSVSHPATPETTILSDLCGKDENMVSFQLGVPVMGGKGGFGSQLRAAGGRMSSRTTSNNDSCRDLSGRRLSTVKEAKKLQTYLESEPERKKAVQEARKEKLAKLERQLGITPSSTGAGTSKAGSSSTGASSSTPNSTPVPVHAGQKRRLDDTQFLEESQTLVENVKSSVAEGLRKKRARMDPPPVPEKAKGAKVTPAVAVA